MHKKRIITFAVIILLIIITTLIIKKMTSNEHRGVEDGFVFDKSSNIKLKDIETYYKHIDFNKDNAKDYFKENVVNPYTIKFFMFLDDSFKAYDNEKDLFENVYKYLHATMPADMAEKLFDLYKKFVSYQLTLGEKAKAWGMPKTTEEAVHFLHRLQDYRREVFGKETADILFGASVKAEEYPLRRGAILADKTMYAAEKEKKLNQLNEDMWGNEADKVDAYAGPYTKYKEKLSLYDKDLSEMSDEGKKAQIRAIREEFYTREQIQEMENVDQAIEENYKKESDYKTREAEILNDSSLDKAEKDHKIQELQNQMYGDEADALRRRLAIDRASPPASKK